MHIALYYTDGGIQTIAHDLNFSSGERYEKPQKLTFKNPKPNLLRALQGIPKEENGGKTSKRPFDGPDKKSKKRRVVCHIPHTKNGETDARQVDVDKMADALQKLGEDDLLQIVQIVNDGKTDDMYVRNDLEGKACSDISFHDHAC